MSDKKLQKTGMTDMTQGSPLKLIVMFSLPLLMGNIFQQLYNTVDSVIVGRFVGTTALAAVGTGFPIIFMLASLFMGIGLAGTVIISQYYGAGDMENVTNAIDTIYTGLMVVAIPLTLLGMVLSGPLLRLIQVPADTYPLAHTYVMIIFGGISGTLGFNVNHAILQGIGDSKTPVRFLILACGINIALDLLFVIVFKMGVAGVALATIIAQMFSWVYGIRYINKHYKEITIRPFCGRFDKKLFAHFFKMGIPSGIQQALFAIGIMALSALVNQYGSNFIAGFNGANKLDTFVGLPIQSIAAAVTTFVGQNIGAGKLDRVKQGTRTGLTLSVICSLVFSAILLFFGRYLLMMFSAEPLVIEAGMAYVTRIAPFFWMMAIFIVLNSVMRGAGEAVIPMLSSILSLWLARVPSAYIFNHFFGRDNMFFCFAAGWVIGIAVSVVAYFRGNWRKKAITNLANRPKEA